MGMKKMTPKWSGVKRNGYFKLGANNSITRPDVSKTLTWMIEQTENKPEPIVILVGIEGDIEGKNWFYEDVGDNDLIASASNRPMNEDSQFQAKDIDEALKSLKLACECERKRVRDRIEIHDVSEMDIFKFGALLTGAKHVILAYNYGRNDKAFRHYLNLKPVLTYIEILPEKTQPQKPNDFHPDCCAANQSKEAKMDEANQVEDAEDDDPVGESEFSDSIYVYDC